MGGRGWAWTAYDWDERRLFNYIGDAQNSFPVWNATPLVALDVYEHAYFVDFGTDRGAVEFEGFLAATAEEEVGVVGKDRRVGVAFDHEGFEFAQCCVRQRD